MPQKRSCSPEKNQAKNISVFHTHTAPFKKKGGGEKKKTQDLVNPQQTSDGSKLNFPFTY